MTSLRALIAVVCFLTAYVLAYEAHAQTRPADAAAAEALFDEAIKLMAARQNTEACPKLAESQRLDPAVGTLLYLGECYERTGRLASAWATFRAAASAGRKSNQQEREKIAEARARALEDKIPKLRIVIPPEAQVRNMKVLRDGTEIGHGGWDVAVPVDPGVHVISISAPGKQTRSRSVQVKTATVVFTAEPLEDDPEAVDVEAAAGASAATVDRRNEPSVDRGADSGSSQRTWGLVVGGVGVVGVAAGAVFAWQAKGKETDSEAYCKPDAPSVCSQDGVDLLDEANRYSTMSLVGLSVGGAALVTGVVLYLTAPDESSGSGGVRIAPVVARDRAGIGAFGRW